MATRDAVTRRDDLDHERALRATAEQNLREVLGVLRSVAASHEAEVAARVDDARAAILAELQGTNPAPVVVPDPATAVALQAAQRELALYRIAARAGVRAGRLDAAVRLYRDDFTFLDDGMPIVGATADTDVVGFFLHTVFSETPELFHPDDYRQACDLHASGAR